MKAALIMIGTIAKSTAFGGRAALFVTSVNRRTSGNGASYFSTLQLQLFPENTSTQRRRHRTTAINHLRSSYTFRNFSRAENGCVSNSVELKPFSWSDIIDLFTDPNNANDVLFNKYIPSDHPNLALFRRSVSAQDSYEKHKSYLSDNWKSPYDYLVYSKFGEEFGFKKELIQVDPSQGKSTRDYVSNVDLVTSPEGFRYECTPSLSKASDYTIQNGLTYLKLVPNDFPYDVEEGIQHWCLWKIGGKCLAEGILMEEMQWALQELNQFPPDGVDCSSSLVVKQNELSESYLPTKDHFSTFFWVNPPHLQSMPEIHHAHILCKPTREKGRCSSPPPV